jgi:hypothetical protein
MKGTDSSDLGLHESSPAGDGNPLHRFVNASAGAGHLLKNNVMTV